MVDIKQIRKRAVEVVDQMEQGGTAVAFPVGHYCRIKKEGTSENIRFRSEFFGEVISVGDIHDVAAVFAEISNRLLKKAEAEAKAEVANGKR